MSANASQSNRPPFTVNAIWAQHPDVSTFTPTLRKSRMPQILGVEGEAVVLYREPSTTQEMRYPRL
jgi:hypothetical protein